jgi:FkbM family methyltransferase
MPDLIDLGSRPGGWTMPTGLLEPSWICYLVGAGGDICIDLDLIRGYGVTVRSFDAVAEYVTRAYEHANGEPRFSSYHAAIAAKDGPVRMQTTHHPGSLSVSAARLYDSHHFVEAPGRTLPSLMAELGDQQIDLLKLDIEGSEYDVVPGLDLLALGVKVFAVQFHHNGSVADARRVIASVRDQGYDPVACRPAVKVTFTRRDLISRTGGGRTDAGVRPAHPAGPGLVGRDAAGLPLAESVAPGRRDDDRGALDAVPGA